MRHIHQTSIVGDKLHYNSNLLRQCRRVSACSFAEAITHDHCHRSEPHVGHLHSMLLADVYARYWALREPTRPRPVLCTGTDEHGLKIQRVAESKGLTPLQLCDAVSPKFKVGFPGGSGMWQGVAS